MKYPVVVSKESDEISVYPMYLSVVRISSTRVDRLGQCRSLCIGL
ncbi:unnamed protein product [Brassica oleracea]|uniref:(rape) hypothetical protein n=1 Tax=Brassica napus TaxID=3708 RepID=A0A816JIR9_BRANA|nr:unnamed protein product [Brassica napus]